MSLEYLEINTNDKPDACVIWLHGLGADGHDFEGIIPELELPNDYAIRFILPHAPSIPVTINNNYVMPAWYDITQASINQDVDYDGLAVSVEEIRQIINQQVSLGIDSKRIILAGFSQGGAVVYECALTHPQPLAGALVLSSYFATHSSIEVHPENKNLSFNLYHGTEDPVVPFTLAEQAIKSLQEKNITCQLKGYPMQHNVSAEEIMDISSAIQVYLST